ncbi:hypothetical protein TNCV_4717851 [Trichonephila clavipes]|nr:hypothetical protein TNCV_4717851 [Trichonephila clavipes]
MTGPLELTRIIALEKYSIFLKFSSASKFATISSSVFDMKCPFGKSFQAMCFQVTQEEVVSFLVAQLFLIWQSLPFRINTESTRYSLPTAILLTQQPMRELLVAWVKRVKLSAYTFSQSTTLMTSCNLIGLTPNHRIEDKLSAQLLQVQASFHL